MDFLFGFLLGFIATAIYAVNLIWKLKNRGYLEVTEKLINFLKWKR